MQSDIRYEGEMAADEMSDTLERLYTEENDPPKEKAKKPNRLRRRVGRVRCLGRRQKRAKLAA